MTWAMRLNGGKLMENGDGVHYPGVAGNGWTVNVIADGTGFGNAEPLVKTMNTLMTQGSWESIGSMQNRAPALIIEIEGDTPDGLNAGEVWLSALMKSGALEWLPPRQSVWTVFDMMWAYIDRTVDARWDLDELVMVRTYRVPIMALPYARSPQLTVTPAAAASPTDIVVSDGSSATGYAGAYIPNSLTAPGTSKTTAVVSGAVRVTSSGSNQAGYLGLRYTLPAAIPSDTPYLRVDARSYRSTLSPTPLLAEVDGSYVTVDASMRTITSPGGGITAMTGYYLIPAGTTAIRVLSAITGTVSDPYLEVDQIRRVSQLPASSTGRQKVASLTPGGSAPADGSLHVAGSTGLGKVLLYTYPLGRPSPALMQYQTAGATPAANASMVNGQRVNVSSSDLVLTVPDPQLPVRGLAALWVKLQVATGPNTVTVTVTPTSNGVTVGKIQTKVITVGVGTDQLVPIGHVMLPGAVTGRTGAVTIKVRASNSSNVTEVDELWACGVDDQSALLIVDAGTGTPASGGPASNLWVNAPTPATPAGEVLIGTNADDARWPSTISAGPMVHKFPPGGVSVLTVTTAATDGATDLTHYKRWTHHAAQNS